MHRKILTQYLHSNFGTFGLRQDNHAQLDLRSTTVRKFGTERHAQDKRRGDQQHRKIQELYRLCDAGGLHAPHLHPLRSIQICGWFEAQRAQLRRKSENRQPDHQKLRPREVQGHLHRRHQNSRRFRRLEEKNFHRLGTAYQSFHHLPRWTHHRPRFDHILEPHSFLEQIGKAGPNGHFDHPSTFIRNLHGIRPHHPDGRRPHHLRWQCLKIHQILLGHRTPSPPAHQSHWLLHEVDEQGGHHAFLHRAEKGVHWWAGEGGIRAAGRPFGQQLQKEERWDRWERGHRFPQAAKRWGEVWVVLVHPILHYFPKKLDQSIQTTLRCHLESLPISILRHHLHHPLLLERRHYQRNNPKQPGCPLLPHHEHRVQLRLRQCQPLQLLKTRLHSWKIEQHLRHLGLFCGQIGSSPAHWNLHSFSLHRRRLLPLQSRQQRGSLLQISALHGAVRIHELGVRSTAFNAFLWCRSGDGFGASPHHPLAFGRRFLRASWDSLRNLLSFPVSVDVPIRFRSHSLLPIRK